jgi:Ca2+-transporting ATPase
MQENQKGLSEVEVRIRIAKYGPNILPEKKPDTDLVIFISQLKNPLVFVLLAAMTISVLLGDIPDSVIIALAVVINTFFGFFQERQASKVVASLKKLITVFATVVREGKRKRIEISGLTVGDLVILSGGTKIPGDGILRTANRVFVDESILTGESVPVQKNAGDEVFMGTTVLSGLGDFEIARVGRETEIGKIAQSIQETVHITPLKRQLLSFSRQILLLVLALTSIVFILGLVSGRDLLEIFQIAVALAVSSIPEGLLVSMTIVLTIGMRRMARRKGLVRNLTSAETLGGVSTICIDKTGTLTEGKMGVSDFRGNETEMAVQSYVANDLDDPLVISAYNWAKYRVEDNIKALRKRLDSIPFSSKSRYFASLNTLSENKNVIYLNGAPDILLNFSKLSAEEKKKINSFIEKSTSEGKRLLGLVRKEVPAGYKKIFEKDLVAGFEWIGIIAFTDPVRLGVKESLEKAAKAGLKVIVITGDYQGTALSVMHSLGMQVAPEEIISGDDLEKLDLDSPRFKAVKLFARTKPDDKLKIVEALKRNGEVVAMMGDGVNDAPALNRADIGIVVGDATDVAKESADLILVDSNFDTVIAAIEEGRGIFDNLRKIILYLLSDAFSEIIAVLGALIMRFPVPLSPSQILWINLVSDGFPSVSLSIDPKRKGIMKASPRHINEQLVSGWMKILILFISFTAGLISLAFFIYFLRQTGDVTFARSIAFASLGVNSLIYVFSVRNLMQPFWKENPFRNKWLNFAVIAGAFLHFLPFSTDLTRSFWGIRSISLGNWALVLGAAVFVFMIVEFLKMLFSFRYAKDF